MRSEYKMYEYENGGQFKNKQKKQIDSPYRILVRYFIVFKEFVKGVQTISIGTSTDRKTSAIKQI